MPIRALLACCGVGTRPISIIDLGNSCMAPIGIFTQACLWVKSLELANNHVSCSLDR
ncbi:hypothetical protein HanHA300_Chr00c0610g0790701 [Helianthus annuus]|nr:hypothetical protein HanHA89_Chr00c23g0754421 [Helianthus annuus]KAJ0629411.1 hypothetical protein HanHA89_Chr00c23g0754581 [Helianthus annuus]KAJ0629456.1 hypothetical protein HanHA300_Chr00c0610g0790701 [Helianthus annuus]KAJ0815543.1 hypothetical protein HanLR1_Chr00c0744g0770281 [Helianthus annuus]